MPKKKTKPSKKDLKEMHAWIYSEECECIFELETFQNCCGTSMDFFEQMEVICKKARVYPPFRRLTEEKQKKIIEAYNGWVKSYG
jgi:hypothetical protein